MKINGKMNIEENVMLRDEVEIKMNGRGEVNNVKKLMKKIRNVVGNDIVKRFRNGGSLGKSKFRDEEKEKEKDKKRIGDLEKMD